MDIEISFAGDALHLEVENPYKMNTGEVATKMSAFLKDKGVDDAHIKELFLSDLLPKMVRGVAGCEAGCPANAHMLVRTGFKDYSLQYIEGGILSAKQSPGSSQVVEIKVFPDF